MWRVEATKMVLSSPAPCQLSQRLIVATSGKSACLEMLCSFKISARLNTFFHTLGGAVRNFFALFRLLHLKKRSGWRIYETC